MQGLSSKKAAELLLQYGKNEIKVERRYSIISAFLSQFKTLLNAILFTGAAFSFLIGNIVDASFILAILILSAVFGFFQEYNAEK